MIGDIFIQYVFSDRDEDLLLENTNKFIKIKGKAPFTHLFSTNVIYNPTSEMYVMFITMQENT